MNRHCDSQFVVDRSLESKDGGRTKDRITGAAGTNAAESEFDRTNPMPNRFGKLDKQQPLELTTDFLGEHRHELVAKVAYKFWEERGRPFGSPDVDWFAAERAVYSSLVASA
jgi:hypothetical protein